MRLGVVADVHANLAALEAVLAALAEERVDRLLCAGDLVGYGPDPDRCVERLLEAGAACVAGNHDLMALGELPTARADALARRTLEWTRATLAPSTRATLAALPLRLEHGPVVLAHGSLDDPEEYVRTPAAAAAQLAALAAGAPGAAILVLGHTHRPMAHAADRGPLRRRGPVRLGGRVLLNPGSVGQPRERRLLARFLVVDTARGEARFRALPYDDGRTRRRLAEEGLPPDALHRRPTARALVAEALRGVR